METGQECAPDCACAPRPQSPSRHFLSPSGVTFRPHQGEVAELRPDCTHMPFPKKHCLSHHHCPQLAGKCPRVSPAERETEAELWVGDIRCRGLRSCPQTAAAPRAQPEDCGFLLLVTAVTVQALSTLGILGMGSGLPSRSPTTLQLIP